MTALSLPKRTLSKRSLPKRNLLTRFLSSPPLKTALSQPDLILRCLLKDRKFNATYDDRRNLWRVGSYKVQAYESLLKVSVSKDIKPHERGQVVFTGGVTYQAETGCSSTTIVAGQSVWAVARYGNTLLVVGQQSALLNEVLL